MPFNQRWLDEVIVLADDGKALSTSRLAMAAANFCSRVMASLTCSRRSTNNLYSSATDFSSASKIKRSLSFSSGVENRSALASVCFVRTGQPEFVQDDLGDLDVVPEDVVVANLQVIDPVTSRSWASISASQVFPLRMASRYSSIGR